MRFKPSFDWGTEYNHENPQLV